ncbi:hypothetical protein SAMD00019534_010510 [Acytostelium subglobosum LB1]|uniref:hypothetical protein n=1 Tax=Acytostelium subglobosum LB1 TaxID=1410327 RepID=UPI0006448FC2|nr:hypothetical protein SAMD00019534_010510 [Acytostelium subglobosum LB1]GAM17876.1 hypothetical protein SAMD00019534_010510 [Acytostelium subglobosum LB1]|eukprot:XP_012758472.1 hypothetical protein SAMD00019534_010510 [Acytostelium subglobosum LB1]
MTTTTTVLVLLVTLVVISSTSSAGATSGPSWITINPFTSLDCTSNQGVGYGLPVNTCFIYQWDNYVLVSTDPHHPDNITVSYYNNQNCTGLIATDKYPLGQCTRINFDQSGSEFAIINTGANYPVDSIQYAFFYQEDDSCGGANYTTFYTDNLKVDGRLYQCVDGYPIISQCSDQAQSQGGCQPIPWTGCIPGSQGGPGIYSC